MYIDLSDFKQKQKKSEQIALVHDFLIRWGGAEKVLKKLTEMYSDAPVYVLFYDSNFVQKHFPNTEIKASFLQKPYNLCRKISKIPLLNISHRILAPLFFLAAESLNLSKFDTVISSAGISKSVITKPKAVHISYVHSPIRWLWQETQIYTDDRRFRSSLINTDISESSVSEQSERPSVRYQWSNKKQKTRNKKLLYWIRNTGYRILRFFNPLTYLRKLKNLVARIFAHFARISDFEAAQRPDIVLANSKFTARRVKKYYNREAEVIYPPAVEEINARSKQDARKTKSRTNFTPKLDEVDGSGLKLTKTGYFTVASRLSNYKKVNIAIRAFKELGHNLVVIGSGPKLKKLRRLAEDNIYFTGFIEKRALYKKTIKNALGFIHPCFEDFGIAMVEALSLGTPVIAPNFGGAREIVQPGINGELYSVHSSDTQPCNHPTPQPRKKHNQIKNLKNTVKQLLDHYPSYNKDEIKKTAQRFTEERFEEKIKDVVNRKL